MRHEEIEELLGAYALDAVDIEELRVVEEHLQACPRCASEVAAHREVAGWVGNFGGAAPDQIWDRIAASIAGEDLGASSAQGAGGNQANRNASALSRLASERGEKAMHDAMAFRGPSSSSPLRARQRIWVLGGLGAIAAALAVVVGVLSFDVSSLDNRVAAVTNAVSSGSVAESALAASLDPRSEQVVLAPKSSPGAVGAELVVLRSSGVAYFVGTSMPGLAPDKTYQIWSLVGGEPVSLGILGADPRYSELKVASNMKTFMVTEEPEGGTAKPTSAVLMEGSIGTL